MELDADYWIARWEAGETGWDIGHAAPAIMHYIDRLPDKGIRILIPGAGNAYEAEYLWKAGFEQVDVLDFSPVAMRHFQQRFPDFPTERLLVQDFFSLERRYDLILEQTFFCALSPSLRGDYVRRMHGCLHDGGVLAGLLFDFPLTDQGPPFGGSAAEYRGLFEPHFEIIRMEPCMESIKPRMGRELWVEMQRRTD